MKNSIDTMGNRTRDLPACSAVPQPTAPLRAPIHWIRVGIFPGIKRQERGTGHTSPSVVKVKNEWPFCTLSQVPSVPS